jgi:hypothetical protein
MPEGESKGFDLLGVKPIAEAIHDVTKASLVGASALLSRICLPAAKEFGLLLKDKVHGWRNQNRIAMLKKAEQKLAENNVPEGAHAHPRVVGAILEQSSWIDDLAVQDMWAGLLASSCTESGDDDSNLVFTDLLGSLTKVQARIIKYACESTRKRELLSGLLHATPLNVSPEQLFMITGEKDFQRLDREITHLRALGLLNEDTNLLSSGGYRLAPSRLALGLYVRCQGSRASTIDFFSRTSPAAEGQPPETPPTP